MLKTDCFTICRSRLPIMFSEVINGIQSHCSLINAHTAISHHHVLCPRQRKISLIKIPNPVIPNIRAMS